jgi:hypothetical protein
MHLHRRAITVYNGENYPDGGGDGEGGANLHLVKFTITIPIEIHTIYALIGFEAILLFGFKLR